MNCESVRKQFPLYLYGELCFDDEERVEQHLDGCTDCRKCLEREKRLQCAFDLAELPPSTELLEQCRSELPKNLQHAGIVWRPGRGLASRLRNWLAGSGQPSLLWMRPLGAVALIAIGFFAARVTGVAPGGSVANGEVATQVRYLESSESGGVRIVFDETRQRELSGSIEDEAVMRMLLSAVKNPSDPGVRVESLDLLNGRSDSVEIRNVLLDALENDPNDGVRLKALEGLQRFTVDGKSREVLSRVLLSDGNPGIRSMAIDLLVQADEADVVETLQELMQKEENNYIRDRGTRALEAMNASVESF